MIDPRIHLVLKYADEFNLISGDDLDKATQFTDFEKLAEFLGTLSDDFTAQDIIDQANKAMGITADTPSMSDHDAATREYAETEVKEAKETVEKSRVEKSTVFSTWKFIFQEAEKTGGAVHHSPAISYLLSAENKNIEEKINMIFVGGNELQDVYNPDGYKAASFVKQFIKNAEALVDELKSRESEFSHREYVNLETKLYMGIALSYQYFIANDPMEYMGEKFDPDVSRPLITRALDSLNKSVEWLDAITHEPNNLDFFLDCMYDYETDETYRLYKNYTFCNIYHLNYSEFPHYIKHPSFLIGATDQEKEAAREMIISAILEKMEYVSSQSKEGASTSNGDRGLNTMSATVASTLSANHKPSGVYL